MQSRVDILTILFDYLLPSFGQPTRSKELLSVLTRKSFKNDLISRSEIYQIIEFDVSSEIWQTNSDTAAVIYIHVTFFMSLRSVPFLFLK